MAALFSYPFVFVRWPITRDFPWANLLLFGIAVALLFVGVRRAWTNQKPREGDLTGKQSRIPKIVSSLLATVGVLALGLFVFAFFIASRWLPASQGAPKIGQKAPDFTLADTNGRLVSLSELLTSQANGTAPKGVLLIFYRGYW